MEVSFLCFHLKTSWMHSHIQHTYINTYTHHSDKGQSLPSPFSFVGEHRPSGEDRRGCGKLKKPENSPSEDNQGLTWVSMETEHNSLLPYRLDHLPSDVQTGASSPWLRSTVVRAESWLRRDSSRKKETSRDYRNPALCPLFGSWWNLLDWRLDKFGNNALPAYCSSLLSLPSHLPWGYCLGHLILADAQQAAHFSLGGCSKIQGLSVITGFCGAQSPMP